MTWILFVAAGLCALGYLVFDSHTDPSARRSASKTASVLLLSGLAMTAGGPWLLVAALALSAAGDFFLSRAGDRSFLLGMAAFFSAHLAYIWLMLDLGTGGETLLQHPLWLAGLLGDDRCDLWGAVAGPWGVSPAGRGLCVGDFRDGGGSA